MVHSLIEFVTNNPELVVSLLVLLVTTLGIVVTTRAIKINRDNRFYDKFEADSLFQIEQNLKDIERILKSPIHCDTSLTLYDILDHNDMPESISMINSSIVRLSPYFAEYCSNLDKYNANVLSRKKICFTFQEHSKKARAILTMFEKCKYEDISLSFAKIHLISAGIINKS